MRGVRGHRPGGGASGRGARLVARLIKTEAVVEGRTEVRWTLVEEDSTPEWPADQPPEVVGEPTTRLTAGARLSGSARYTSDIQLPRQLEAAVLRSPHANARLTSISLDAARAVPGVRAVIGPGDCPPFDGATVLHDEPPYGGGAGGAGAAGPRWPRSRRRRARRRTRPWPRSTRSGSRSGLSSTSTSRSTTRPSRTTRSSTSAATPRRRWPLPGWR